MGMRQQPPIVCFLSSGGRWNRPGCWDKCLPMSITALHTYLRLSAKLYRLAAHYLKWRRLGDVRCRFDVVAVTLDDRGVAEIRHIPAAFDATGM